MRKYEEAMEHISVTPEMRARALERIRQTDLTAGRPAPVIRRSGFRRFAALAACLAVVLAGVLTLPDILTPDHPDTPGVALPAGPVEVSSVAELSALAGFPVSDLSDLPFAPDEAGYSLIGDLAQIGYQAGEDRLTYRKAPGNEDISGDYNVYAAETEVSVGHTLVTLKGSGGTYVLAVWTSGGYAYSLSLSEGMPEDRWEAILAANLPGGQE